MGNDDADGPRNYDVLPHFTDENQSNVRFKSIARQKRLK